MISIRKQCFKYSKEANHISLSLWMSNLNKNIEICLRIIWSNESAIIGNKQDYLKKKKDESFGFLTWYSDIHHLSCLSRQ